MPHNSKGAPKRARNDDARSPRGARPGSKSPSHRGHRGESDGAQAKQRWAQSDRDRRDGGSTGGPAGGKRGARGADRPNWTPYDKTAKHDGRDRNDRGDRRDDRGDRSFRTRGGEQVGREPFGGDRRDRGYGQGDGRPSGRWQRDAGKPHGGRATHDRFQRDDRAGDREPRRGYDDRAPRRDDRAPSRFGGDDRAPRRDDRRDDRAPRRDDRSPRRDDRAPRRDDSRGDRRGGFAREPRAFDKDERARRSYEDRQSREPAYYESRRDSTYYPSKDAAPFEKQEDVVLDRLQAKMITAEEASDASFADLGLGAGIVGALGGFGATSPFPIQTATIPDVLKGKDVLGRGKTGSGKTIAFGAPIVELLLRNRPEKRAVGRPPRAIILAPTRELAAQIDRAVQSMSRAVGIFTTLIVGGVRQAQQVNALGRGVDILIGTPGRIEDLVAQGYLDLGRVEIAVLDEADHMCDLGFLEPVQRIMRMTRPDSQKLLFSATLDSGVAALVNEFLDDPAVHEVAGEDQASSDIDHKVLVTDRYDKDAVLEQIVRNPGRILVFTRTRAYAERLADQFADAGIPTTSLHGDLTQGRRTRNLDLLKKGKVDVLVATDVAARGIHVDDIALVVQADPPDEYKTYMHRSGRTGRAGHSGAVVTVIAPSRRKRTQELLQRAEIDAPMIPVVPGDDILDSLTLTAPSASESEAIEAAAEQE